jgi:DNA polymerase
MDARDRLRLFLEHRREQGESELILDALPVEEVLRLIGAATSGRPAAPPDATRVRRSTAPDAASAVGTPPPVVQAPPPPPPPRAPADTSSNWREVLGAVTTPSPAAAGLDGGIASPGAGGAAPPSWLTALGVPLGLSVGDPVPATLEASDRAARIARLTDLDAVAAAVAACTACPLSRSAKHPVPGEGAPDADFVCVGEAPGATEDEQGRPFVGPAGQLLTRILGAIQLSREEVFIANVLKHRPPGNRDPLPDEVRACEPFLLRQLDLVRPRVLLALGTFAAQTLLGTTQSLGALRGRIHRFRGVPVVVTYHPAALLRNESWKRPTWDDVQLARRILDASRASAS